MGAKMKTNGIILGEMKHELIIQPTNSQAPNRNHFIVGGPGSYKTQSYVVTNMINERECSIACTDPKGEVYEMTAGIKKAQGYEVHVVNFSNMEASDRYNPFDYVKKDVEANTVANTVVASKNDPKRKDIWYNSQLSLLKALILYVNHEKPPEERNMSGVLQFLQEFDPEVDQSGTSELDQQFLMLEKTHPARKAYELGFKKSVEKTRSSIIISLLTTISDFVDEEVAAFTNFSDFHLSDIGKRKIALYVIIPVMDSTWEGLINLFFNQMFNELYKLGANNKAKLPQPVFFILDEFPNLGRFDDYEKFLATCRGYGIGVATIVQNLTQLQAIYGREKAESILGNCAVKICLGNVNETSAKYFLEQMGKATVKVETGSTSRNTGRRETGSASESFSYTGRNLMNLDEILTMGKNESIVVIAGKHPVIAKKAFQFTLFPEATDLFDISQADYQKTTTDERKQNYKIKVEEFLKKQEEKRRQAAESEREAKEPGELPPQKTLQEPQTTANSGENFSQAQAFFKKKAE
ncbi:VirD4-like conjugal transfer protein, CD1115 family [Thalassorhabdus alkalitolerans]|uniref:VirD4-like conjugal transfer protein, CD1115 family n=1 Tax=Thalassorhabdus alkalitolerans TaxID=2282697 RepID=A0ABW0YSK3_9BACI